MCDNIVFFGVYHWDPLGREKIVMLLNDLRNKGFMPDCIATEWDKITAQKIIDQRKWFIKYAKIKAPYLNDKTLDALSNALAYEADSHISLYPDLPMIWLDEGRKYQGNYAADRFNFVYMPYIDKLNKVDKNNLQEMSKLIWKEGYTGQPVDRDRIFYNKITTTVSDGYKNIFAIVGARHANTDINGSCIDLLMKKGFRVQTYILGSPLSI